MITKFRPAGNLFPYIRGPRKMNGDKRDVDPVRLRGNEERATAVLDALAPPWVTADEQEKARRKVRHHRRHLTHLMSLFSESREVVEAAMPSVIDATEALILAGLPKDSVSFVWYEHPEELGTHAHCGMVNLVVNGGYYDFQLDTRLLHLFDRLASRAWGLSDPLDPEHARLVGVCLPSAKKINQADIAKVVQSTREAYSGRAIESSRDFIQLLKQPEFGFKRIAYPGSKETLGLKNYKGIVAVETADERIICFRGPVCVPGFSRAGWEAVKERRREERRQMQERPAELYREFGERFQERCRCQQAMYHVPDSAPRACLEDLAWLDPDRPLQRGASEVQPAPSPAIFDLLADSHYPFTAGDEGLDLSLNAPYFITSGAGPVLDLTQPPEDIITTAVASITWPQATRPVLSKQKVKKRMKPAWNTRAATALAIGIQSVSSEVSFAQKPAVKWTNAPAWQTMSQVERINLEKPKPPEFP